MADRRAWTREELLLAIDLYCRTRFGRIHARNPSILKLAEALTRTPNALAMKMVNFASLDPSLPRRGLGNVSRLDREVWNEVASDWTHFALVVSSVRTRRGLDELEVSEEARGTNRVGEDAPYIATRRIGQQFFREVVLATYDNACAITGMNDSRLLVASHIIPWGDSKKDRLDPQNGICLNSLHDRAFDRGLITFDQDFRLLISRDLGSGEFADELGMFKGIEARPMTLPRRFLPSQEFLEYHRTQVYLG